MTLEIWMLNSKAFIGHVRLWGSLQAVVWCHTKGRKWCFALGRLFREQQACLSSHDSCKSLRDAALRALCYCFRSIY